jgi:hypothetical protein
VCAQIGQANAVFSEVLQTICGFSCVFECTSTMHKSIRQPRGQVCWFIGGVAVLDSAASVANGVGLTTDQVAVISVLASLFSVVTISRALILGMLPNWQLKDRSVLEYLASVDWVATGQAIALGP